MSVSAAIAAPIPPRHPTPLDVLRALSAWLSKHSIGARLLGETKELEAMSDADLARRGLDRDRIVPHVFAPYYGI